MCALLIRLTSPILDLTYPFRYTIERPSVPGQQSLQISTSSEVTCLVLPLRFTSSDSLFSQFLCSFYLIMEALGSRFERITVTDENDDGQVVTTTTYHKSKVNRFTHSRKMIS